MPLDSAQQAFLDKRRRLTNWWRPVGVLLLLGGFGLTGFLYYQSPLLINFFEVLSLLKQGKIEPATSETALLILPVVTNMLCGLFFVLVLVLFAVFANERKYQKIIDALDQNNRDQN